MTVFKDERAGADYWLARSSDEILLSEDERRGINRHIRERSSSLTDLGAFPALLGAEEVREMILSAQQFFCRATTPGEHFDKDGEPIGQADYDKAKQNCNFAALRKKTSVRYALTLRRVNLRLLPARQNYFDLRDFRHYDDLQGTALDPAEPLIVLHESRDCDFVFALARYYEGWVKRENIVFTDRAAWEKYVEPEHFLTVTANKILINCGDEQLLFQMGGVLPVDDADGGRVYLPRRVEGKFSEWRGQVCPGENLRRGWLPCTSRNFVCQAFKFLGDVYGWGGMEESVDCSSFVGNIYRSMGLEIPRDADWQETGMPYSVDLRNLSAEKRRLRLIDAPTGALLFKPGHVMMYLGRDEGGTPTVIHALSSYFTFENGRGEKHYHRRVTVSDLHLKNSQNIDAIDTLTSIGYFRRY